uniref:Uncharacterized protein n=1 Tax=viral metagenome TaxID=1070528 RepID=A0A6M3KSQ8_9ZZZZ
MSADESVDYSDPADNRSSTGDEPANLDADPDELPGSITSSLDDDAQNSGDTEEGAEEEEASEEQEQIESLTKQLNDTKGAFAKSQEELHKLQGKLEAHTETGRETGPDWLDEVDASEAVAEPGKFTVDVIRKLRDEIAGVIIARDNFIKQQLEAGSAEHLLLKPVIDRLKADPDYAGFSLQQLAVIAKKEKAAEGQREKPENRGKPGGGRAPRGRRAIDVKKSPLFRKIYGNQFDMQEEEE